MRNFLKIVAIITGILSILAGMILGIIYLTDISAGIKKLQQKLKTFINNYTA